MVTRNLYHVSHGVKPPYPMSLAGGQFTAVANLDALQGSLVEPETCKVLGGQIHWL